MCTPLDVVNVSNCVEIYPLKANICSHIIRIRLQLESGDEQMEEKQMNEKKELLKQTIDRLDEKKIDELLSILHKEKRTP